MRMLSGVGGLGSMDFGVNDLPIFWLLVFIYAENHEKFSLSATKKKSYR